MLCKKYLFTDEEQILSHKSTYVAEQKNGKIGREITKMSLSYTILIGKNDTRESCHWKYLPSPRDGLGPFFWYGPGIFCAAFFSMQKNSKMT